jgi:pimeloyl-ACP methyl ester carboxylesterase
VVTVVVVAALATGTVVAVTTSGGDQHAHGRSADSSTTATTRAATPTTLPALASDLVWSDCGGGFQCGQLTVPVDWHAPAGDRLQLALARHPATGPEPRAGSLVINYGGPGDAGTEHLRAVWARLPDAIRARFDVVSWDPRGTGQSRPIDCVDDGTLDAGLDLDPVPRDEATLQAVHAWDLELAQGCAARMGAYATSVGTRNTARDLEAIRRALGEAKLTFLGYSYGTKIGIVYAQMFPANVAAMVLDGPADWWQEPLLFARTQAKGFADALQAFLSWCENEPTCALRNNGAPRAVFDQLLDRVQRDPPPANYLLSGVLRTGRLDFNTFMAGVISMLYDETRGWPALAGALSATAAGGAGALLSLADQYLGRAPNGTWSPLVESNSVISCDDGPYPAPRSDDEELADIATFQAELPPFGGSWAQTPCLGMPRPPTDEQLGDVHVSGVPPILIVGTTGDPATPYAGALVYQQRIARSALLTFVSTEHTAYGSQRSTCIDQAVDAYLLEGTLPAPGTRCQPG